MTQTLIRRRRGLASLLFAALSPAWFTLAHAQSFTVNLASDQGPFLRLTGNGDLSFWIFGGGTNALATPPAQESEVPTNSVDTLNGGWHGVALRNVATGDFVLTGQRTNNATDWQMVRFTAAQLAELDTNAVYTLDVIDARNNAWSWFNFDSVRIPGVLVPQGPALKLEPWPDGSLRLAWPLSASDYRLEVAFDLPGPWEDAGWHGFYPAAEGEENVVYVPPWEAAQFFRLVKP